MVAAGEPGGDVDGQRGVSRPKYSVVIPCLNGEQVLPRQLRALAAQDYPEPFEIVVADNRSTDRTKAVVDELAASIPGLRYLPAHEVKGANHARNVGVRAATGSFILFCDSDDVVSPGWVTAFDEAVRKGAVALGGQVVRRIPGRSEPVGARGLDDTLDFLPRPIGASCALRKDVIEQLGYFDEAFLSGDETELFWRAQLAGNDLVYVPDAIVDYSERTDERSLFRQRYIFGKAHVNLYLKFREQGMARPNTARSALRVGRFALQILRKPWSREHRREPLRGLALLAGHLVQSLRTRTLYF